MSAAAQTDTGAGTNPEHPAFETRWEPDTDAERYEEETDCPVCDEPLAEAEWATFVDTDGEVVDAHGECAYGQGWEHA